MLRQRQTGVPAEIGGDVDEGYGAVADEFRRNFAERGELGAAVAVYRDGRKVVDLWGGIRDAASGAAWRSDTLIPVFSTSKGMSAMTLALAHSWGLFDLDAPVARYWPEFAAAGKGSISVRQLLAHQAGLSGITPRLRLDDLADLDRLGRILAAEPPAWPPGTRQGYHGITLGWYESELLRRIDPAKRSLGRFFADEIGRQLGLEFFIGLPQHVDRDRIAKLIGATPAAMLRHPIQMPWRFVLGYLNPRSLTGKAFGNPRLVGLMNSYNREDVQRVEIPAANGIGLVRSIAAAYGEFACGGERLGLAPGTLAELRHAAAAPSGGRRDLVLGVDTAFSFGYLKPLPLFRFGGESGAAFGTPGAGGSFGFADPETGIGYGYAPNRAGLRIVDDPREVALRDALFRTLGGPPQQPVARPGLLRRVIPAEGR